MRIIILCSCSLTLAVADKASGRREMMLKVYCSVEDIGGVGNNCEGCWIKCLCFSAAQQDEGGASFSLQKTEDALIGCTSGHPQDFGPHILNYTAPAQFSLAPSLIEDGLFLDQSLGRLVRLVSV